MVLEKWSLDTLEKSRDGKILFTKEVMVFFALVCVFIFGWFPKTKHNELMFSGRMNVSLLYEMGHGNGLSACVMCGTVP